MRKIWKGFLSLVLVGLLVHCVSVSAVSAASKEEQQARFAEKVKAGVAKLGTGTAARVEVKLRDKTRLRGYVSEAGEKDFVVVEPKTGALNRVEYAHVKQIKGNNLSTGAKIAIGLGIAVAILVILLVMENYG